MGEVEVELTTVNGTWVVTDEYGDVFHEIGKGWSRAEAEKRFKLWLADRSTPAPIEGSDDE